MGETDVPDSLDELILQRRRWLNGSFFAAVYALAHFRQVLNAGHSFGRKCMLTVEMVYNVINLIFAWFAIGNFFLFFVSILWKKVWLGWRAHTMEIGDSHVVD